MGLYKVDPRQIGQPNPCWGGRQISIPAKLDKLFVVKLASDLFIAAGSCRGSGGHSHYTPKSTYNQSVAAPAQHSRGVSLTNRQEIDGADGASWIVDNKNRFFVRPKFLFVVQVPREQTPTRTPEANSRTLDSRLWIGPDHSLPTALLRVFVIIGRPLVCLGAPTHMRHLAVSVHVLSFLPTLLTSRAAAL